MLYFASDDTERNNMTPLKLVLATSLTFTTVSCSKSPAAGTTPTAPPITTDTAPTSQTSAQTPEQATAMLAAYERVRRALAADDANVVDAAREIEAAASAAAATPGAPEHYKAIASGAATLAAATDLSGARKAFGEISRHVIELLAIDNTLAQSKFVFECPMAKGYRKWVQTSDALENPYMGKRMLHCGVESTWD